MFFLINIFHTNELKTLFYGIDSRNISEIQFEQEYNIRVLPLFSMFLSTLFLWPHPRDPF